MSRKISTLLSLLLAIFMSGAIIIYGKKGEDKSKENIFAVKYNSTFISVSETENFNLDNGPMDIGAKINLANANINDLELFISKNTFIPKNIVEKEIESWREILRVESENIYLEAINILGEIKKLDINNREERNRMQDKINVGFQYANTLASLALQDYDEEKVNNTKNLKSEYQQYQDSIERALYNELEIARNDLTQKNIDTLMSMIPGGFPLELKAWYVQMGTDMQNQLLNKVLKEVGNLYSDIENNKDKATIEHDKNKIERMLTEFFNSSNKDIRLWAKGVKVLLSI